MTLSEEFYCKQMTRTLNDSFQLTQGRIHKFLIIQSLRLYIHCTKFSLHLRKLISSAKGNTICSLQGDLFPATKKYNNLNKQGF